MGWMFLLFLWIQPFPASAEGITFFNGNFQELTSTANKSGRPFFIFFSDQESQLCQKMEAETFLYPTLVHFAKAEYIPFKVVNMHSPESVQLTRLFNVQSFPSVLIFTPDGEEVDRLHGFLQPEILLKELIRCCSQIRIESGLSLQRSSVLPEEVVKEGIRKPGISPSLDFGRKTSQPIRLEKVDGKGRQSAPALEAQPEIKYEQDIPSSPEDRILILDIPGFEPQNLRNLLLDEGGYGLLMETYSNLISLKQGITKYQKIWGEKDIWVYGEELNGFTTYFLVLGTFDTKEEGSSYQTAIEELEKIRGVIIDLSRIR